ncbi:MAG: hypothetical protein WAU53_22100, partial [Rhodoplanes sp.]
EACVCGDLFRTCMSSIILFRRLVMANSFARWNAAASSHSIVSKSELLRNARKGGAIDKVIVGAARTTASAV